MIYTVSSTDKLLVVTTNSGPLYLTGENDQLWMDEEFGAPDILAEVASLQARVDEFVDYQARYKTPRWTPETIDELKAARVRAYAEPVVVDQTLRLGCGIRIPRAGCCNSVLHCGRILPTPTVISRQEARAARLAKS